jgi:uncharacterized membrane protein YgcG
VAIAAALSLWLAPGTSAAIVPVPDLTGPVVDQARLLAPADGAHLERLARAVRAQQQGQGVQLQFLILPSLEGEPIEDLSIRVADKWKIGSRGQDNGLLFVVARDERQVRIEVGYGLEKDLTDAQSGAIIREVMAPAFRAGDFGGGLLRAAVRALAEMKVPLPLEERAAAAAPAASLTSRPAPAAEGEPAGAPSVFSLAWITTHTATVIFTLFGLLFMGVLLFYVVVRPLVRRLFPGRFAEPATASASMVAGAAPPSGVLPATPPPAPGPSRSDDDDEPSSASNDSAWSGDGGRFGGGGATGGF